MKVMSLPECDKLIYCSGTIGCQIGALYIYDDEKPMYVESYPILGGGRDLADGQVQGDTECYETPVVCRVGEKIFPTEFSSFVKRGLHEEVGIGAWELYRQLRENGSDLRHPVMADTKDTKRDYMIELEFHDFKQEACCVSTDSSAFYFEAYYDRDDKESVYRQLDAQLMDYINILDTEELYCRLIFTTLDLDYMDVVDRLNSEKIDTRFCDMYNPR